VRGEAARRFRVNFVLVLRRSKANSGNNQKKKQVELNAVC
jgi:hypothetical protein